MSFFWAYPFATNLDFMLVMYAIWFVLVFVDPLATNWFGSEWRFKQFPHSILGGIKFILHCIPSHFLSYNFLKGCWLWVGCHIQLLRTFHVIIIVRMFLLIGVVETSYSGFTHFLKVWHFQVSSWPILEFSLRVQVGLRVQVVAHFLVLKLHLVHPTTESWHVPCFLQRGCLV